MYNIFAFNPKLLISCLNYENNRTNHISMSNIRIKKFTFNPFQENTYLVYNDSGNAFLFDPGCSNSSEEKLLFEFIGSHNLRLQALISTHCHIDHILGNHAVLEKYDIPYLAPDGEQMVLGSAAITAQMYQLPYQPSPSPDEWINTDHHMTLDGEEWTIISAPGHSPASLMFYLPADALVIGGDVLFRESIGRTDLPGGNHELLLTNIREKLFRLPDDVVVYPGHGPETTIGYEKRHNPFVRE